ncbi:hypothetical protein E3P99_00513 [Wallemia hederae]|uniref:NAD(P)-binding protein n=1 Tax=Wallemia hederae TaxID=1540922 RepID=A0A4T0FV70_9BASI|nr:hypothetical protein E3P99_00513 [Wallemia hederae]
MLDAVLSTVLPTRLFNLYTQSLPPSPTWTDSDIPDLSNKVMIVTGASSGIGKDTARSLLSHNAKVYIGGRDIAKVSAAIAELYNDTGKTAHPFIIDLSDFGSVKSAANAFLSKEKHLDVLFNNAGVMAAPVDMLSKDGYDIQFQTNVMSHYLLSRLLHPALASSTSNGTARVVHTSSMAQSIVKHARGIDFDEIKDGHARRSRNLDTWELYGYSKVGNTVIANILNRQQTDVSHSSCHPGVLQTELWRHMHMPAWKSFFFQYMVYPSSLGSLTQLYLGTVDKETKGLYGIPWAREGLPDKRTADPALNKELEEWLDAELKPYL